MAGKMEQRAKAFCADIRMDGSGRFTVEWRRSQMWGNNAVICNYGGEKMVIASGCGYDKESAAVVQLLHYLVEDQNERFLSRGGAGMQIAKQELAKKGWILEKTHSGVREDGYFIYRAEKGAGTE